VKRGIAICWIALGLTGCAQMAVQQAVKDTTICGQEAKAAPEGQVVHARLWNFDDSDTAAKLRDPAPLTKEEQNALVQLHNKIVKCREIVLSHDRRYAAWETQYWQEYFQRSDAIFYKLASGEIPVGLANKLSIESAGKFQTDVSKGHADAVRVEEAQQQRAAEAMMQAGAQLAASQPRTTTTNCTWLGNTLNCTSFH
jgi:hypothetical protein